MTGRGKASRPDTLADREVETEAFLARVGSAWRGIAEAAAARLGAKALPDVDTLLDLDDVTATMRPIVQAHMQRLAEVGAWDVLAQWDPDGEAWGPEQVEAWIARAAETNAGRMAVGVKHGLDNAVGSADPEDGVRSFLDSDAIPLALAAAFAAEAFNFGGWDAAKKSGLGVKTWQVNSRNPRPSHAALNGQTVRIDDVFGNGLRWPGDALGTADDNAGCTCSVTYQPS